MIKIIVDTVSAKIIDLDNISVIDKISNELSYHEPGHKYVFAFKIGKWDGLKRLLSPTLEFPSGLVSKVCDILKDANLLFEIEVKIDYPEGTEPLCWHGPTLYDYQEDAVSKIMNSKIAMAQLATGAGKSNVIAKVCAEHNLRTIVYVISLDLLGQLHETLEKTLGIKVGMIGAGKCDIRHITVASVWSCSVACGEEGRIDEEEDVLADKWTPSELQQREIRDVVQGAQLVILDESHFCAARSIQMIMKNSFGAVYKYGFTATPFRENDDTILLEAIFGPTVCNISASYLIERGYLVQPKILFKDFYSDKKIPRKWPAVKSAYIINNEPRNMTLVENAVRLVEAGRKPLMLYRDIKHGQLLLDLIPDNIKVEHMSGKVSMEERIRIRNGFKNGEADLLICSSVADQGLDVPNLDALILCAGGKSRSKTTQRLGRILRVDRNNPEKVDALVVETYDMAPFVDGHSIRRYDTYRTEPQFKIKVGPEMEKALRRRK